MVIKVAVKREDSPVAVRRGKQGVRRCRQRLSFPAATKLALAMDVLHLAKVRLIARFVLLAYWEIWGAVVAPPKVFCSLLHIGWHVQTVLATGGV